MKINRKNVLKLKKPQIEVQGKYYYIGLVGIPAIGIVVKNILLQSFILGSTMYKMSILNAIAHTWKYWSVYLAVTMILLSFSLLFTNDLLRKIYIFGIDVIITALIYGDLIYNRSFYTMPSAINITMLSNFEGMESGEITSLLSGYDLLLFIDVVILAIYIFIFKKSRNSVDKAKENSRLRKSFIITIISCVCILFAIPVQAKALNINKSVYEDMYLTKNANEQAMYFTSIGFHVKDIYELIDDEINPGLTKSELKEIYEYYDFNNVDYSDQYQSIFEGKNVIFIQVESLEQFVIGNSINGQEITPNLNELVSKGIYFKNIYEQVKCGNSSDADLMYTSSVLPANKGCTFYRFSSSKINSLQRMLEERGYETTYHQAISDTFWNYKDALTNMIGFQQFNGLNKYESDEKIGFTISDKSFLNQTVEMIEQNQTPFYSHIVCNSSHMPFSISKEYQYLDLPSKLQKNYLGQYFQCIRYVDESIGNFVKQLDKDGKLENTIIVIAGDHTGVHKYYEDKINKLYDEYPWCDIDGNYTVPLIIYSKDLNDDKSVLIPFSSEVVGGQIDVMPTLAYLLGIDQCEYQNTAMGKNLFDQQRSYAILRDGSIIGETDENTYTHIKNLYEIADNFFRMVE